tara:strand:+ start:573 stop:1166 length:594 start_codon:yes stop_codon:yes gene_type:complete
MRFVAFLFVSMSILLFAGCSLFPSNNEDKFEPFFTAEINGEPYDARYIDNKLRADASLTNQGNLLYLNVFGDQWDPEYYPYFEQIGFSVDYIENKTEYSSILDTVGAFRNLYLGGSYYEVNGDATISKYDAKNDTQGYLVVNFEPQKNGKTIVSGTFEMRVIVNRRADQYSLRVNQDTLYITNGKYRLKLDDRTEDD